MTYTVIASNPNTNEIGIASTTITINFGRAFPVTRHLAPELLDRGIIVAPMATVHPQNGHRLCDLRDAGVSWDDMEAELQKHDEHWSWRQIGAGSDRGGAQRRLFYRLLRRQIQAPVRFVIYTLPICIAR